MIEEELYKKIVESVPIVCVDVIIKVGNDYLLVKRTNEPLKDKFWLVGGRAYKGERTVETARRKVREEIGLDIHRLEFAGVYEDSYEKSAWGVPTSSVSIVYRGFIDNLNDIKFDNTISEFRLTDSLPFRFKDNFKR